MNKLTALIEAAKGAKTAQDAYPHHDYRMHFDGATILELCALLEKAEEALDECDNEFAKRGVGFQNLDDALAAIKQWKEGT